MRTKMEFQFSTTTFVYITLIVAQKLYPLGALQGAVHCEIACGGHLAERPITLLAS